MARLEGYRPTKAEKTAIAAALKTIERVATRDWLECLRQIKLEASGYGRASDRVPLCAAQGLFIGWIIRGIDKPETLLRDCYYCRPASLFAEGLGAALRNKFTQSERLDLRNGHAQHEAAFARMMDENSCHLDTAITSYIRATKD